jgi:hypothetical protein
MGSNLEFSDVRRRLRPEDVFTDPAHDWTSQSGNRWKGGCPWHGSESGTCFSVNPETLEWYCHSCGRGGGPLEYVAELERLQNAGFLERWKALAEHASCKGPGAAGDRSPKKKTRGRLRRKEPASAAKAPGRNPPRKIQASPASVGTPDLKVSESTLRDVLLDYRKCLRESDRARAYIEGRGLPVETLHRSGCGYAAPGEWIGNDDAPRLVTPHTTASGGRLVNLSGRYLGDCDSDQRHRHIGGNPTALFNASAIAEGSGPLVLCEGPLDALSFIEAGWKRTMALHNTGGVPWGALRGAVETLVFAFDRDETGTEDAVERCREALLRGYRAHTLHDEPAYAGHGDPNEALQAGELGLDYLKEIEAEPEEAAVPGSAVTAGDSRGLEVGQSPGSEQCGAGAEGDGYEPADLMDYWHGDDIGYLGQWLWERKGVPDGDVGGGVYADRELHKWVKETLEAGPHGTTEGERKRLRWVLWRLYAARGPEEVPEVQIPDPPESEGAAPETANLWDERSRDPYRSGRLPSGVGTTRTDAPTDNLHPGKRGIEIDSPYSEEFVHDLKVLPEWARTWNGDAWVVDDTFARFVGDLCRDYFAR